MKKILSPILRDKPIYLLSIVICIITYGICYFYNAMQYFELLKYVKFMLYALVSTGFLYFLFYYFYLLFHLTPHPIRHFFNKFKYFFSYKYELINMLILFIALSVVLSCFSSLKTAISEINPFYLDPLLAKIDQAIHFGYQPWAITHALFSSPWSTAVINFCYNIWFFIVWIFMVFVTCQFNSPAKREKIIISMCLVWIINGGVLAILLSSAGPVYAHKLFPEMTNFKDLIAILHQQNDYLIQQNTFFNVWSLKTQQFLWHAYTHHSFLPGSGISAMPSVHVSTVTLIALSISKLNKKWGILAWAYTLVIFIASVHLGWHYACDGYLGAFITITIWTLVGLWQKNYSSLIKNEV